MTLPNQTEAYDIAVIGAGPAGGSAAAALAARGWQVALVERTTLPRHKVCGEFLSPEAQGSLRTLGVYHELAACNPSALTAATLTTRRGTVLELDLPGCAWGLSRFAMDAALAQAAAARGADVIMGTTATEVVHEKEGVEVTLRQGAQQTALHARAVVMAGGRHGTAHLPPAASTRPRTDLYVGVKAHYANLQMPNRTELFLFDGGYVGVNPVESDAANVCALVTYAEFARCGRTPRALLDAMTQANTAFARRVTGGRLLDETICTVAAVDTHRPSAPWAGMACLGDTATMIPPLCGDGMAMALRSAELCVPLADEYLRGSLTLDQWQTGYTRAWHEEFAGRLRVGRAFQGLFQRGVIAESLAAAGKTLPWLADYFVRATRGSIASPVRSDAPVGSAAG